MVTCPRVDPTRHRNSERNYGFESKGCRHNSSDGTLRNHPSHIPLHYSARVACSVWDVHGRFAGSYLPRSPFHEWRTQVYGSLLNYKANQQDVR